MITPSQVVIFLSILALGLFFTICKTKGVRSFLSLVLTFVVCINIFIPGLLNGYDPLLLITVCALPLTAVAVYLTEGFTTNAHRIVIAITLQFIGIFLLTWGAVHLAGLSGITSEEDASIQGFGKHLLDLPKILAAGIILGTLGAVTEMIVTQIATVAELRAAHPEASNQSIFTQAYTVGVAHLGSMINTLFLIYASVSLPILIILSSIDSSWHYILKSELFQTECIRTLVGVISLITAMPLSTWIAVSPKITRFLRVTT